MNYKLLLGLILATLILAVSVTADLKDNNILYYSFDGNTENGEIYGGTPIGALGVLNGSIDFDGTSDYLDTGITTYTDSMSLSFWTEFSAISEHVISVKDDATNYFHVIQNGAADRIEVDIQSAGTSLEYRWTGLSALEDGNPHHVVIVIDQTATATNRLKLYIDGSLDAVNAYTSDNDPSLTSLTNELFVGGRNNAGTPDKWHTGEIDEVIFTSDEITSGEVTTLYGSGSPTTQADDVLNNIVYYNPMDSLFDWSPQSIHANVAVSGQSYITQGIINGAFNFTGGTDYIQSSSFAFMNSAALSFGGWIYYNGSLNADEYFYSFEPVSGAKIKFNLDTATSGKIEWTHDDNTGNLGPLTTTSVIPFNEWVHVVGTINSTHSKIYVNGVEDATSTGMVHTAVAGSGEHTFGAHYSATAILNGSMDEVFAYSRAMTPAEVLLSYNSGAGNNFYAWSPPAGTETVTLISPPANDYNNTYSIDFKYNTTNTTGSVSSCTLYIDGESNQTDSSITPDTTQTINSNFTADGSFSWLVGCTVAGTEYNSSSRTLTLDSVQPTILTSGLTNLMPVTYGILGSDLLKGQINLSDDNLYSLNISTDVETIYYNSSLSPLTTFNYTLSHNISAYSQGLHTLTIKAADGHTAKRIDEYNYRRGLFRKNLKFDYNRNDLIFEKDYVNIEVDKGTLDTEKLLDRYVFDWSSTQNQNVVQFTITSDHYIDIVQDSKYAGHLIVPALDKWIDFEIEDATGNEEYHVMRVSDNEVTVRVTGLNKESARFRSIGDLNINTLNYTFYIINATETYISPTVEGATTDFVLNFEANGTYTIAANFTYNGTTTAITPSTTTTNQIFTHSQLVPSVGSTPTNLPFNWSFSIDSPTYANVTPTQNQVVHQFLIDDCSSYTTQAYNITFKNEETFADLAVNSSILIEYNYTNVQRTYGQSFTEDSNVAFCINPAWANMTGDITLQYNYNDANRDFITSDTRFDNDTIYQDVYLLLTGGTDVTVTVVDTNDLPQANVIVEAWRYNLSNAVFYMVESEITDPDGRSVFTLVQNNPFYKFLIYQDSELELETDKFKITQTEYEFVIGDAVTSPVATWIAARSIDAGVTYDNATSTVTYAWTDADGAATMYCLNVTYDNGTGVTYSCSTTSSSTLTYVLTDLNSSYYAQGMATISGQARLLDSISIALGGIWQNLGTNFSLGIAFLVFLVIALIGVWSPQISVIMASVGMITLFLVGLVPIGLTALIGFIMVGLILIFLMRERLGA